jgi:Flp pilus assembly protein TadG
MKAQLFPRPNLLLAPRPAERGVTMVLVAICMVTIIGMAALSIDVVTLYLAREEAQRAADAAALAGARTISLSGITTTGDPANSTADWKLICGGTTSVASLAAQAAGQQNAVANSTPTVNITYSARGTTPGNADCSSLPTAFAINPTVIATVTNTNLPTLFSRIWSRNVNSVSATAAAEVLNPSNSGSITTSGDAIQVVPRCVKPWIIPNRDPGSAAPFVNKATGAIQRLGIVPGPNAFVGEGFALSSACTVVGSCSNMNGSKPAAGTYVPALVTVNPVAFPACADDDLFQEAIGGCDESTAYQCGIPNGSNADLSINPGGSGGDTAEAGQCLINQKANGLGQGQDALDVSAYPYKMLSGSQNPILPSANTQLITASNSVVSLPIYDQTAGNLAGVQPQVTILGYLQVFIDSVDSNTGNVNLHVLNVAGCGNDASTTALAPGTSPLPIRLITTQ